MSDPASQEDTARQLVAVGRYQQARESAGLALADMPESGSLHRLMAEIQWQLDELGPAEHHLEQALRLDPSVASFHLGARFLHCQGRLEHALSLVDEALRLRPDHEGAHMRRALILADGRLENRELSASLIQARDSAEHARRLDPEGRGPAYTLAVVSLAEDQLVEAAEHLTRALALDATWSEAHSLLGIVRLRQGMSRLASRHFVTAGKLHPGSTEQLRRLRSMARRRRWFRRDQVDPDAVWLAPEARSLLRVDLSLPASGDRA